MTDGETLPNTEPLFPHLAPTDKWAGVRQTGEWRWVCSFRARGEEWDLWEPQHKEDPR